MFGFRRKSLLERDIRRRFAVTLTGGEGEFLGILVDADDEIYVFDDCYLVTAEGKQKLAGQMYVDRIAVAYRQKIATGG